MSLAEHTLPQPIVGKPGWYRLHLPADWNFFKPSGGVLTSIALRAIALELNDPELRPVSSTSIFAEAVPDGDLLVEVTLLRRGRAASQARARLVPADTPEAPGMELSATFARSRPGPKIQRPLPEPVPSWKELEVLPATIPFFQNLEDRVALGHLRSDNSWQPGPMRFARWLRYVDAPWEEKYLPEYAFPPILDLMPPPLIQGLGPEHEAFLAPSLDLTCHYFARCASEWMLLYGTCRWAEDGYSSVDMELRDEDLNLVAFATQVMLIKYLRKN